MTDIEYPLEAPSAKVFGEPRLLRKRRVQVPSRNAQDRCVVVAWLQQSVEAERRSRKPLNPAAEDPARNVNTSPKTEEKWTARLASAGDARPYVNSKHRQTGRALPPDGFTAVTSRNALRRRKEDSE